VAARVLALTPARSALLRLRCMARQVLVLPPDHLRRPLVLMWHCHHLLLLVLVHGYNMVFASLKNILTALFDMVHLFLQENHVTCLMLLMILTGKWLCKMNMMLS
jgi:hypothetical protein